METDAVTQLLEQARNYRRLGNAMQDRTTRLALLELAFEFEERARRFVELGEPGNQRPMERPSPRPE